MKENLFKTDYGYFHKQDRYVITRPDTPRPWINIIANERYGLTFSQAGGGFSWIDHSALSVLTRWEMDLVADSWGKWLYIMDLDSGKLWSAAPQPANSDPDQYKCIHGIGYSILEMEKNGIRSEWMLTVPPDSTFELWQIKLSNLSRKKRRLVLCSAFMWCLGKAPDSKREFHKLFIENSYDSENLMITARKHIWDVPDQKYGHWNREWPYTAFHCAWDPEESGFARATAIGDYQKFTGRNRDWKNPSWLYDSSDSWEPSGFGRHHDSMAGLKMEVDLEPGEEAKEIMFSLGAVSENETPDKVISPYSKSGGMKLALRKNSIQWKNLLENVQVKTPDPAFDLMNNAWLAYQAISCRLWARTGYWQQSGAFGFRDQLQDSQVFLPGNTNKCLKQIKLHAKHQFSDGTVYHWWHPLSEQGLHTEMTDDLIWLPFVLASHLKETGDFSTLDIKERWVDEKVRRTLWEHCYRAIKKVLSRFSPRELPLIGEGDWNDGLSSCGLEGKGESIWLGHFLYQILNDWSYIAGKIDRQDLAIQWNTKAMQLKASINEYGWDGEWYLRATLDDGSVLGGKSCKEASIFLNAQTWAVISGVAKEKRAEQVMDMVEKHLLLDYGPVLFQPAFSKPDKRIGYLTRYAPGTRENGGLYTHAATWAIQAACKLKRADTAWKMFKRLAPPYRGMDPDHYTVEPYVTPGNVDGPDSPNYGRGGWTWYTGSAAWLRKICLEWIIGVRPEWDGLMIDPCLPPGWKEMHMTRHYQGNKYEIFINNPEGLSEGECRIKIDGKNHPPGKPVKPGSERGEHEVMVTIESKKTSHKESK